MYAHILLAPRMVREANYSIPVHPISLFLAFSPFLSHTHAFMPYRTTAKCVCVWHAFMCACFWGVRWLLRSRCSLSLISRSLFLMRVRMCVCRCVSVCVCVFSGEGGNFLFYPAELGTCPWTAKKKDPLCSVLSRPSSCCPDVSPRFVCKNSVQ